MPRYLNLVLANWFLRDPILVEVAEDTGNEEIINRDEHDNLLPSHEQDSGGEN